MSAYETLFDELQLIVESSLSLKCEQDYAVSVAIVDCIQSNLNLWIKLNPNIKVKCKHMKETTEEIKRTMKKKINQ